MKTSKSEQLEDLLCSTGHQRPAAVDATSEAIVRDHQSGRHSYLGVLACRGWVQRFPSRGFISDGAHAMVLKAFLERLGVTTVATSDMWIESRRARILSVTLGSQQNYFLTRGDLPLFFDYTDVEMIVAVAQFVLHRVASPFVALRLPNDSADDGEPALMTALPRELESTIKQEVLGKLPKDRRTLLQIPTEEAARLIREAEEANRPRNPKHRSTSGSIGS